MTGCAVASFRFWSDTNQRGFEHVLRSRGIAFETAGYCVVTDAPGVEEIASDWGATRGTENATEKSQFRRTEGARHSR